MTIPRNRWNDSICPVRAPLFPRLNRWLRGPASAQTGREADARAMRADAEAPDPQEVIRRSMRTPRLVAEPWYVDNVSITGTRFYATGWSMPVHSANEAADGLFRVNGRCFDTLRYPFPRPDVGDVFWMRDGSGLSGFEGAIENLPEPYPDGILEIERVVPDTPPVERGRDSWFKPDPARHTDLPDAERRFRVIGDRNPDGFLISGATDYHRMDRAIA